MRYSVSFIVLFFLSIPAMATDFVDGNGLIWKISGDFKQCLSNIPIGETLIRSCSLEPTDKDKMDVESSGVCGFKNGKVVINIKLSKKSNYIDDIAKDLLKSSIGKQDYHFKSYFESDNPEYFEQFLNLFCSRGIICNSLVSKLLELASTELDTHSLLNFKLEQKLAQEKLDLIDATNRVGRNSISMSDKISSDNTLSVMQHRVAYTDVTGKFSILSTFGAGPCVILALYNRQSKKASLAHIDSATDLRSVDWIFGRIRDSDDTPLEIHLAGGNPLYRDSKDLICSLISIVNNTKNIVIKSSNLNAHSNRLALDCATGDIDDTFDINKTYISKDFNIISKCIILCGAVGKTPLFEQKVD